MLGQVFKNDTNNSAAHTNTFWQKLNMVKNTPTVVIGLIGISSLGYMFIDENSKHQQERSRTMLNHPKSDLNSTNTINATYLLLNDQTARVASDELKIRLGTNHSNKNGIYELTRDNYCKKEIDFGDQKYFAWRSHFIFQQIHMGLFGVLRL